VLELTEFWLWHFFEKHGPRDFQCTYCAPACDFGHIRKCHKLQADFCSQCNLCTVSHASKNSPSCESSSMLTTNSCKHLPYHILLSQSVAFFFCLYKVLLPCDLRLLCSIRSNNRHKDFFNTASNLVPQATSFLLS
jgi:hypothetical protein